MDLLTNDEAFINISRFDSSDDGDLSNQEDLQPSRRLSSRHHNSNNNNNRQHRFSSGSKVYLTELSPRRKDLDMEHHNSVIVSAVERTMKNYADGVLRVLEGMSGRLSHLESTTQDLEQSIAALKVSVNDYHGKTDQNVGMLNERIMEMHRAVQILRDKQDIIEAQAQLAKLQTSKTLVEKESAHEPSASGTADSVEAAKHHQQQESLQVQPQQSLTSQQHTQQSLPQSILSQPQHVLAQPVKQYQAPGLQSQQQGPMQHLQQEAPLQIMQQGLNAHSSLEQVQFQVVPQQMQMQQQVPQQTLGQQPVQVTTQHTIPIHQPLEQVRFLAAPQQMQMQQPLPQQPPGQQSPQVTTQRTILTQQPSEQVRFQSVPQQMQIQQPVPQQSSGQQPLQGTAQQTSLMQQPPQMQQTPSSHLQGSFQHYAQPNDSQSYTSLAPGTLSFAQSGYAAESSYDSTKYASHQHPSSLIPTHQTLQPLPPNYNYQQLAMTPLPVAQPPHDSNAGWNRQTSSAVPSGFPRLQTAQPVHGQHPSGEINGVIDKVVAMGFSRDQVQSVIKRLTEKDQSVDMNIVLDTLMNGAQRNQGGQGR